MVRLCAGVGFSALPSLLGLMGVILATQVVGEAPAPLEEQCAHDPAACATAEPEEGALLQLRGNASHDAIGLYPRDGPQLPGKCPGNGAGTPEKQGVPAPDPEAYATALEELDIEAVKEDVRTLLTNSQPCWPADFGNYGPFFIRLAWHCSGTFRLTDGVGGCAGGRQRFNPEASWADNVNLDKARALVAPLKQKYGDGLSWGDLFAVAGTEALRAMGTPIKSFCFGRIDDSNGVKSLPLGPSHKQKEVAPCTGPKNGMCQEEPLKTALAPTTIGDIYVNPQGPMGVPDTVGSAKEIRVVFGKMGHGDRSTVALIGGGHAFGKAHGACNVPGAAGLPPNKAYEQGQWPWQGKCGSGVGNDTFSSGIEGPWTTTPTKWTNEYFRYLVEYKWENFTGPGGSVQWRLTSDPENPLMRMTTDMALLADANYSALVHEFATNFSALDEAFDTAWTGLTIKGGMWSTSKRCDGPMPPADLFQPLKTMMLQDDPKISS